MQAFQPQVTPSFCFDPDMWAISVFMRLCKKSGPRTWLPKKLVKKLDKKVFGTLDISSLFSRLYSKDLRCEKLHRPTSWLEHVGKWFYKYTTIIYKLFLIGHQSINFLCELCSLFLADFQIPSNLEEAGSWNMALAAMVQDSNHIMLLAIRTWHRLDIQYTWGPHQWW